MDLNKTGLVIVYTGDGKGKTTAALGTVFRALGHGFKCGIVQFIKNRNSGEREFAASCSDVDFYIMGEGFVFQDGDLTAHRKAAEAAWKKTKELVALESYTLLVLDEIFYAVNYGFIDLDDVIELLAQIPADLSIILTGRDCPKAIIEQADLVTQMQEIKHPYRKGRKATPGIEY